MVVQLGYARRYLANLVSLEAGLGFEHLSVAWAASMRDQSIGFRNSSVPQSLSVYVDYMMVSGVSAETGKGVWTSLDMSIRRRVSVSFDMNIAPPYRQYATDGRPPLVCIFACVVPFDVSIAYQSLSPSLPPHPPSFCTFLAMSPAYLCCCWNFHS